MKKIHRFAAVASLVLGFGFVSVVPAFAASKPAVVETSDGQHVGTIVVPDGLKDSDVQRAILEGVSNRGWTIKAKEDGKVVIFLEQGRWSSQLTLKYDAKEVQIYSKSLRNGKPGIPEDWIKYVKQDVTKVLNAKAFLK